MRRKFLKFILHRHAKHGGVTEIRLIQEQGGNVIRSGYWDPDHLDELIDQLAPRNRDKVPFGEHPRIREANVYVCLHPADPTLLARSANSFAKCPATANGDIVAFDLVLIDIDSVRPSGISATKEEKGAAREVRDSILKWLAKRGITPIQGDSGNGYHLLIPTIPYPDPTAAAERTAEFLKLLDKKFSTVGAKIDTGVSNPARISKVYGTLAMKGTNMPDRPHRFAKVQFPENLQNVNLFKILKRDMDAFAKKRADAEAGHRRIGVFKPARRPNDGRYADLGPENVAIGAGDGVGAVRA